MHQTVEDLDELLAIERELRTRLDDIDQRLAIQLGLVVEIRLRDLDAQLERVEHGADPQPVLAALRAYIDDELRPLSHRLSDTESALVTCEPDIAVVSQAQPTGAVSEDLDARIRATRESISRLRQRMWVIRRRAGFALHGGLQAALHVAVLHLAAEAQPSPELVAAVRHDIRVAAERVTAPPPPPTELGEICRRIAETWSGTSTVTWDVPAAVEARLRSEPTTVDCATEVLLEAAQNSVRHGGATRVHISARTSDDRLTIDISDDGTWVDGPAGLGSRVLHDFCSEWSRTTGADGTKVIATLLFI